MKPLSPIYQSLIERIKPSDKIQALLKQRDLQGWSNYGRPMEIHDGRDGLQDSLEEALDLMAYLEKSLQEIPDHDTQEEITRLLHTITHITTRIIRLQQQRPQKTYPRPTISPADPDYWL